MRLKMAMSSSSLPCVPVQCDQGAAEEQERAAGGEAGADLQPAGRPRHPAPGGGGRAGRGRALLRGRGQHPPRHSPARQEPHRGAQLQEQETGRIKGRYFI